MSTSETAGQETPASTSRLRVSDELGKNAKGAVKSAVEILGVAAAMTQNVPYLGIISGALSELLKIYNATIQSAFWGAFFFLLIVAKEVDILKSEWKTTASTTRQIKSIIDKVHEKCEKKNMELPEGMIEPLNELERIVFQTLETLTRCRVGSKRWRDRARTILSRGDLVDNVKQCRTGMQDALNLFMAKLQIDQTFVIHAIAAKLDETGAHPSTAPEFTAAIIGSASLPPAPAVFHGRAQEIDHVVELLANKSPARVAILGSGGIGKTSIALTALHRPEIEALYGDRRFFASCEAASNADGIVQELLKTFGLAAKKGISSHLLLLSHMHTLSDGLLCLDNLETPWDDDMLAVESLLARIAALPRFALLVTTRGADRPLQVAWTQPFLPQIAPLTFEAALKTWDAICGSHDDYAEHLIKAIDCVPLAVTLLAHLAESEASEVLWARWERELTDLVRMRGPDHRLSNVDISVRLSLHGPRLRDDAASVQFFSVLCTLPQGIRQSQIPAFVEAYAELLPNMYRSIATLKQCALSFTTDEGFLRVLSPVRHYMQAHHPISPPLFARLAAIYQNVIQTARGDWAQLATYARDHIQAETANITTILKLCLAVQGDSLEQTAADIDAFSQLCATLSIHDTVLLSEAITRCSMYCLPAAEAKLWLQKGHCLYYQVNSNDSLTAYEKALGLYRSVGDRTGEAECLQSIGVSRLRLGQLTEAEYTLSSAQILFNEIGNRLGEANSLQTLGNLYVSLGQLDKAERALLSVQALYDEIGGRLSKANCLRSLGTLYMRLDRVAEAERALLSAQTLYNEIGARMNQANCEHSLGDLYRRLGRYDEAERALLSAQNQYDKMGELLGKAHSLSFMGKLYIQFDRLDEAERALLSARDIFNETGGRLGMANTLAFIGTLRRRLRQYDDAIVALESANQLSLEMSYLWGQGEAHHQIGLVHADRGQLDEAEKFIEVGARLLGQEGDAYNVTLVHQSLQAVRDRRRVAEGSGQDQNV